MRTQVQPASSVSRSAITRPLLAGICVVGLSFAGTAAAGTLNIDLEGPLDPTQFGAGVIGKGPIWNSLGASAALFPAVDDQNTVLPNTGAGTGGSLITGITGADTPIQEDAIGGLAAGTTSINVFGLRPDKYYCVVVYNGSGTGTQEVHINGGAFVKTLAPSPGPFLNGMVEGRDYVKFESVKGPNIHVEVKRNSGVEAIAGIQISGWLEGEPLPHQTDLQISKKKSGGYKGANRTSGNQTQTVSGKRTAKFFFRLRNNADICGTYGVRGKGSDKKASRKWFDLTAGRKNVTAQVKRGKFQAGIGDGDHATLMAKVRKKSGRKVATVLLGFPCDDPSQARDKCKAILK